jgi:hypothetical protein
LAEKNKMPWTYRISMTKECFPSSKPKDSTYFFKWLIFISRMIILSKTFIASIVLLFSFAALAAGENRWQTAGQLILTDVNKRLIENSRCHSQSDCTNKELVFFQSIKQGLEIEIYELTEESEKAAILASIVERSVLMKIPNIEVYIFPQSKKYNLTNSRFFQKFPKSTFTIRYSHGNN